MRVYRVEVEDMGMDYCGCESSVRCKPYGLYSSVEAAVKDVMNPEGKIIKELLGGEDWLLSQAILTWEERPAVQQVWPPSKEQPTTVMEVIRAHFTVKDTRFAPQDHGLLYIIDVKEVEVKHG